MCIYFAGFKKGSIDAFDLTVAFTWVADRTWYGFSLDDKRPHQVFGKKLYHELLARPEQEAICDHVVEFLVERVEEHISRLEEYGK